MHKKPRITYKISYTFFIVFFAFMFFFLCDEYNPYGDDANAKANIINQSDTIETRYVFTTERIRLLLTVCNLIEKVVVTAENNRYIKHQLFTDLCKYDGFIDIPSSFYDTGYQEVRVVTYRTNGDTIVERKRYYVLSDLKQNDIVTKYGSYLQLKASTTVTHDNDIKYVWKVGNEKRYKSVLDTTSIFYEQLSSVSCSLKMCDYQERYYSPSVYFTISLSDTVLPSIIIKNEMSNDTLYVATNSLVLQVQIEKTLGKNEVIVDGDTSINIGSNYFVKTINRSASEDSIKTLKIFLVDRFKATYEAEKTIYVVFNSTNQKDVKPVLHVIGIPDTDVVVVQSPKYTLNGQVVFNANNEIKYTVSLFYGNELKSTTQLSGSHTCDWKFALDLEKEHNFFRIEVKDSLANIIEDTTLHFYYCTNCIDTVPPVIASILVNKDTLLANERYTSNSRKVIIELICFDFGKGVKSVMVGNSTLTRDSNASHRWLLEKVVSHITHPDTFHFYAVDSSDYKSNEKKVVIGYNTPPYIYKSPDTIAHAFTGIPYLDSIVVRDDDEGDFITYSVVSENNRLKINVDERGKIHWIPEIDDTGFQKIKICGYDQNKEATVYSYNVFVSSKTLDTVRFSVSRMDFPEIISCDDSLNVVLNVTGGTGPFEYTVTDLSNGKEIAVDQNTHFLKWKPDCITDTGDHQFFILVRDKLRLSDTLLPEIKVIPKNTPFEYTEELTGKMKADSILNMSKNIVDTLFYTIKDPDDPMFEKHTIQVSLGAEKYSIETSSSQFFIPLDPKRKLSGRDSLLIVITDNGGNSKTIKKILNYGNPPTVKLLKPEQGQSIDSANIRFSWSCSDPDNDSLRYTFLLINNGAVVERRRNIRETILILSGLKKNGTYSWSVIARDSKSESESSMGIFTYSNPERVRIDTAASKINKAFVKCEETVNVPIVLEKGCPPYTLDVKANIDSNPPVINGTSMVWTPMKNQAGIHNITLTVVDSVGNTDSFTYPLSVYGSDTPKVILGNSLKRNEYGRIDLSNSLIKEVPCTLLINDPDPSPPEIFTINVTLGGVTQEFYKTVERMVCIALKTESARQQDSLKVTVTDMENKPFTFTDSLYYGN